MSKRIIIKISGEMLELSNKQYALLLSEKILEINKKNIKVGIVIGGGNWIRGRESNSYKLDRTVADKIGMISTIINSMYLQNIWKNVINTTICSSMTIEGEVNNLSAKQVEQNLDRDKVIIFAGGTGMPFCSTDTAAAIRSAQIYSKNIYKIGTVQAMYNKDPKDTSAKIIKKISCKKALMQNISIMDKQAYVYAMENDITICYLPLTKVSMLTDIVLGKKKKEGFYITP